MKRIFLLMTISLPFFAMPALRAQDAAIEERLNKLAGQVQDLLDANAKHQKQNENLAKEIRDLQEQQNHPSGNYATQDDLKKLAEKVQEIDRNREKDKELILSKIEELKKIIAAPVRTPKNAGGSPPKDNPPPTDKPLTPEKGFYCEIHPNDTLEAIVKAYKAQNIKVTVKQILDANPGLDERKLHVGQKIFIPAPQE